MRFDEGIKILPAMISMKPRRIPRKLYKYRAFNVFSLRSLTEAELHYADPTQFNDPLDCDPTIEVDISRTQLERLYYYILKKS